MKTPAHSEAYSNPCQKSKMELLVKITNKRPLTIFIKSSILDVGQGSEYVSGIFTIEPAWSISEEYSKLCQTSWMEQFGKIVNRLKAVITFSYFPKILQLRCLTRLDTKSSFSTKGKSNTLLCLCRGNLIIWYKKTKRSLFKLYLRMYYFHLLFFI